MVLFRPCHQCKTLLFVTTTLWLILLESRVAGGAFVSSRVELVGPLSAPSDNDEANAVQQAHWRHSPTAHCSTNRRYNGENSGSDNRRNQRDGNHSFRRRDDTRRETREPRRSNRESTFDDRIEPPLKVYAYYLATCLPGMASILQDELQSLGCVQVELSGQAAVQFAVLDLQTTLRVLLWTRTAHKILELLTSTPLDDPVYTRHDIYQFVRRSVPVQDLLGRGHESSSNKQDTTTTTTQWSTVSVSVMFNNARYIPDDINHSHYTALNVKNALVDAAREVAADKDDRPSVDVDDADVPLTVVLRGIPTSMEATFMPRASTLPKRNGMNHIPNTRESNGSTEQASSSVRSSSAGAHLSIYRCIHAGSLHRRGYRSGSAMHKAAMKESTAAGLLLAAGWPAICKGDHGVAPTKQAVLIDPMMGSGTFLVEGAMMAADLAPGLMRIKCAVPASLNPPILRWKHDDLSATDVHDMWKEVVQEATARAKQGMERLRAANSVTIVGNDIHGGAYDLADAALQQAGLRSVVQIHCNDCLHWKVEDDLPDVTMTTSPWTVVSNPPWGVRLSDDMHESWEALRVFLRERCPGGSQAWILSGSPEATKHLGLRRSQSLPLQTGEQDLRWLQYEIRDKSVASTSATESESDLDVATASDDARQRRPALHNSGPLPNDRPRSSNGATMERPKRVATAKARTHLTPEENEWLI